MTTFVQCYMQKERRARWQQLVLKPGVVYQKLAQFGAHIDRRWPGIKPSHADRLAEFVTRFAPVWGWDFGEDEPTLMRTLHDCAAFNRRRGFLVATPDMSKALFFDGDTDYRACGQWTPQG